MGLEKTFWLLVAMGVSACGASDDATGVATQAATSANGLFQNGLTTNGIYQNGIYQNGIYQNGIYQNGIYQNGIYQNGIYQNGIYQNGIYQNGIYQNGIYQNGIYQNGIYQNGIYQNGIYQNGGAWITGLWSNSTWVTGTSADALRTNVYARQFLQYVYACAMPGTGDAYATVLDPWQGSLACRSDGTCDEGFACSSFNTCVVPLIGSIGVGVNEDGSTWAQTGRCDESCQRWVSACVLARTNAYGAHVLISMRAPDDAPAAIKTALEVSPDEALTFGLREGAFYGNVFGMAPVNPPPTPDYTGPTDGLVATPSFNACAGPGSNIPEITKRFCSSQGDDAVINVAGVCIPSGAITSGACNSIDADGALHDCTGNDGTTYKEVITVYIHDAIAVCGNAVCESSETAASCPSDCRPSNWASTFPVPLDPGDITYLQPSNVAASPDGTTVFAGMPNGLIDFGSGDATTGTFVAKLAADGTIVWLRNVEGGLVDGIGAGVGVGPDGTVAIATYSYRPGSPVLVSTFASDGTPLAVTPLFGIFNGQGPVLFDAAGDMFVISSRFHGGQVNGVLIANAGMAGDVIVKLSPSGAVLWASGLAGTAIANSATAGATVAPNGNVLVAQTGGGASGLYVFDNQTGETLWTKAGPYQAVTTDAAGDVFAAGIHPAGHDFPSTDTDDDLFVAKYAADGTFEAVVTSGRVCNTGAPSCAGALQPYFAKVDALDNIVIALTGGGLGFDPVLGTTTFHTYRYAPAFVAAFASSDLHVVWAKEVPFILGGTPNGMDLDANGRVLLAGTYSGSMIVDGNLLINDNPLFTNHKNAFVSAFAEPPATDTTAPAIGRAVDQVGTQLATVPRDIVAQAVDPTGAVIFFMPPTAIDDGGAGATVQCTPAPNTVFPIGTTTVSCTATNALGYASTAHFDVTVRDRLAPLMTGVSADISSDQSLVTYSLPTATDQVDGPRPVTCVPASGSAFAPGTTTVTCSASDTHGNSVQASFHVVVTASDTTPPQLVLPSPITVAAVSHDGATVTYAASATDDVGVTSFACTPPSGSTFALGTTTVTCTASDAAGNHTSGSFTVSVVDHTAPQITVPAPIVVAATTASGAPVSFATSALDAIDGTVPVTCSRASGSSFALGATTVTCSASDSSGNTATRSFIVTVQVSFGGLLAPINADGSSEFKLGSIVPVRFLLTGGSANIKTAVATVTITKLSSQISGTHHKLPRYLAPTTGTTAIYNPLTGRYYYRYTTQGLTAGTYGVSVDFHDGAVHTAQFSLGSFTCPACESDGGDD